MKNTFFKIALLAFSISFVSCDEPTTEIAPFKPVVFKEVFDAYLVNDDEYLNFGNWKSFAEVGTKHWFEKETDNNGYLEFTGYDVIVANREVSNIAWAISPKINLDNSENEILNFKTATEYVTDPNNKVEVLISTNFDGTNVLAATWTVLPATIANNTNNISNTTSNGSITIDSGDIDISAYSGDIYLAFRGVGSGTNTNLDGSLRLDNIKIYNKNYK